MTLDPNVQAVKDKLDARSRRGIQKYGVTTAGANLELVAWLEHLQQELMDACVYIEAALVKLPLEESQ